MLKQSGIELVSPSIGTRVIPRYISAPYTWAYINPRNVRMLDNNAIVNFILMGNSTRLTRTALDEISPGQRVLQAGHVYGDLIPRLAAKVGPQGHLDVLDVVPIQVALARLKLRGCRNAHARVMDARTVEHETHDVVSCFFLLHEVPDPQKRAIVDALLGRIKPGGKAVFVDYHRPASTNPMKLYYSVLFDQLEPYAKGMWHRDIRDFATNADAFRWEKVMLFGGVFQKTIAYRKD